jgi:predicted RNA-binding protein YlxR (DUF448 family)
VVVNGDDLVPDPARRLPGRGASLHLDPDCLALAERRRAFGRALRTGGVVVDAGPVREYLASVQGETSVQETASAHGAVANAAQIGHTVRVGSHPHSEEK